MPIFTAAGRNVATARATASRIAAGARGSTRWTPSPCSVHAVPTAYARAPRAAAVATSRSKPAPPEGSIPPATSTSTEGCCLRLFHPAVSYNAPPRGGPRHFPSKVLPAAIQLPEPIQFGKYTLFERIGRGGMAEVFKGRIQGPAGFERVFVVKRILPHLSDDASFIKMFVEEAKLSARLNHPNIVHIFELGAVEGEYFISMEYIRGHDLSETMRAIWKALGPPRPELVAYIGREACRGLAYAHNLTDENGRPLGMIHRDVSPSNVMLSYEGAVKMLDFGIAKALGDAAEPSKSGTLKGKYAYMAPEQTEGDNVDSRSDIFAMRHRPARGADGAPSVQGPERRRRPSSACAAARCRRRRRRTRPCRPSWTQIVLKALQRDPARRWSNAADMADALDDVVHARASSRRTCSRFSTTCSRSSGAPAPRIGQPALRVAVDRRQPVGAHALTHRAAGLAHAFGRAAAAGRSRWAAGPRR